MICLKSYDKFLASQICVFSLGEHETANIAIAKVGIEPRQTSVDWPVLEFTPSGEKSR